MRVRVRITGLLSPVRLNSYFCPGDVGNSALTLIEWLSPVCLAAVFQVSKVGVVSRSSYASRISTDIIMDGMSFTERSCKALIYNDSDYCF